MHVCANTCMLGQLVQLIIVLGTWKSWEKLCTHVEYMQSPYEHIWMHPRWSCTINNNWSTKTSLSEGRSSNFRAAERYSKSKNVDGGLWIIFYQFVLEWGHTFSFKAAWDIFCFAFSSSGFHEFLLLHSQTQLACLLLRLQVCSQLDCRFFGFHWACSNQDVLGLITDYWK